VSIDALIYRKKQFVHMPLVSECRWGMAVRLLLALADMSCCTAPAAANGEQPEI
jgi:hypothetical protein